MANLLQKYGTVKLRICESHIQNPDSEFLASAMNGV